MFAVPCLTRWFVEQVVIIAVRVIYSGLVISIFGDNRCLWCYLGVKDHDPFGVISLKLNNVNNKGYGLVSSCIVLSVLLCFFIWGWFLHSVTFDSVSKDKLKKASLFF